MIRDVVGSARDQQGIIAQLAEERRRFQAHLSAVERERDALRRGVSAAKRAWECMVPPKARGR